MMFVAYLFAVLSVAYGCSEPEGGYVKPTPVENVYRAKHVVVGEVTEIIRPDPMFGDMYGNGTYGAMVTVQCTYKGGPLSGRITIGGAGFIPGHCVSLDVEVGKHYVLFLQGKQENKDYYQQSVGHFAAPKSKLMEYLNICDLYMQYPEGNGMILKRMTCPPVSKLDSCLRYGDTKQPKPTKEVTVQTNQENMHGNDVYAEVQPEVGSAKESKADDSSNTNAALTVISSISSLVFCIVFQLM